MTQPCRFNILNLFLFIMIVFWPVVFFILFYGTGILLMLLISKNALKESLVMLLPFLVMVAIMYSCYMLSVNASWKKRGWLMYISWLVIALIVNFLMSAALGGVSMAVVDGNVPVMIRYQQYAAMALAGVLYGQIFIIPWVFISLFILKKIGQEKIFPFSENK